MTTISLTVISGENSKGKTIGMNLKIIGSLFG